jgi:hypothetical protein
MEDPLIREADPLVLESNMVLFMHMLMVDRNSGLMMSLDEQAIVTDGPCERITQAPRGGGGKQLTTEVTWLVTAGLSRSSFCQHRRTTEPTSAH